MIRAFAIVGLGAFFSGLTCSQTATSAPAFEVASVKVNTSGERPSGDAKDGRFTLFNIPMRVIIARAYQVANDKVMGPGWIDTDGYDIVAKFAPDTSGEALWQMLQNLLAERFKLAIHHERTSMPVYALVVGKNGPKLKEAAADSQVKATCSRQGMKLTCQSLRSTMDLLAQNLPRWLPRDWLDLPVVDLTGLNGAYDFSLTWTLTDRAPGAGGFAAESIDPAAIDLFDAIQDQLGLKLEQRKAPVDRIVIDHIERVPIAN